MRHHRRLFGSLQCLALEVGGLFWTDATGKLFVGLIRCCPVDFWCRLCLIRVRTLTQQIVAKNGATFFNDHIALRSLALQVSREGEGKWGRGREGKTV